MANVNVARDFTRFPSGRYAKNGDTSGESFRQRFLVGPLSKRERVVVALDGTVGYGSSFLEEAFGGLVRELRISPEEILKLISFEAVDSSLIEEIEQYIRDAGNVLARSNGHH